MMRTFMALSVAVPAALSTLPNLSLDAVEEVYWDCDYISHHSVLDMHDAEYCSQAYERLRKEKFDNDFGKFLAWWKANQARKLEERKKQ